jgi:hypothetical protein
MHRRRRRLRGGCRIRYHRPSCLIARCMEKLFQASSGFRERKAGRLSAWVLIILASYVGPERDVYRDLFFYSDNSTMIYISRSKGMSRSTPTRSRMGHRYNAKWPFKVCEQWQVRVLENPASTSAPPDTSRKKKRLPLLRTLGWCTVPDRGYRMFPPPIEPGLCRILHPNFRELSFYALG